jgi:gamma-glutamyl-gamma-aminobutyrate hydrolase PuuD
MFKTPTPSIRIGIYGRDVAVSGKNVGLWASGYQGALTAAGAEPVLLEPATGGESWNEILEGLSGVVFAGFDRGSVKQGDGESLCLWCSRNQFPLLAIDHGMLVLNAAFGGLNYQNLSREMPEALQHRHPPEPGLRHAIMVQPETLLCELYGEGEIVVNSEHRQAVQRVAQGFQMSGAALDGVCEAIESINRSWFALGVQWQPASASASGLDIQVFRGLVDATQIKAMPKPQKLAMAV